MVRVRLFAALRDAAGTAQTTADADRLDELLDTLCRRYGEPFRTRVRVATAVVDDVPVPAGEDRSLEGVEEVVLLPPFAGG